MRISTPTSVGVTLAFDSADLPKLDVIPA